MRIFDFKHESKFAKHKEYKWFVMLLIMLSLTYGGFILASYPLGGLFCIVMGVFVLKVEYSLNYNLRNKTK